MKMIVGLGNPGVRYENTRHNAGFMTVDEIAKRLGVSVNKEKFEGKYVKVKYKGEDVVLLKPETYMNDSGFSIRACMDFFKIAPEDILVIYDDLDTPVGSIRLRNNGSAGGHNGIKSVLQCALKPDFKRIRVGIGRDPKIPIINYVLSRFKEEELAPLDEAVKQAADAALFAVNHEFPIAMNRYNKKAAKKEKKPKEGTLPENTENPKQNAKAVVDVKEAADAVLNVVNAGSGYHTAGEKDFTAGNLDGVKESS